MDNYEKFPFDYSKHIIIKRIISPYYRHYTETADLFQGVSLCRCDQCMIQGQDSFSRPFKFDEVSTEEIDCILKRMGLVKIIYADVILLTEVQEVDGEHYCLECQENLDNLEVIDEELTTNKI